MTRQYSRQTYNYQTRPVRDWPDVLEEYNRRNPHDKITSVEAVRTYGSLAMKKLREALADQQGELLP